MRTKLKSAARVAAFALLLAGPRAGAQEAEAQPLAGLQRLAVRIEAEGPADLEALRLEMGQVLRANGLEVVEEAADAALLVVVEQEAAESGETVAVPASLELVMMTVPYRVAAAADGILTRKDSGGFAGAVPAAVWRDRALELCGEAGVEETIRTAVMATVTSSLFAVQLARG